METAEKRLFERYESFFNRSLGDNVDMNELATLHASDLIGAAHTGVMDAKNDDEFKQFMAQGYDHSRAIGAKEMRIRNIRLSPIDELHCVAHVAWTATYARKDRPDVAIDFDVHYLVQMLDGEQPKVFGW